jgi:hypothetical protein
MGALLVLEARSRYGGSEGEREGTAEWPGDAGGGRAGPPASAPARDADPDRADTPGGAAPADPADLSQLPDPTSFRAIDGAGDPFRIPDVIAELEDAIVTLSAHVHAANHRILCYLAELDRLEGWKLAGHRDCAEWLSFRTGLERGSAQEWVRTARALRRMPLTSAAMSRGELSYSKVRCLTRAVDDLAEAEAAREEELAGDQAETESDDPESDDSEYDDPDSPETALVEFARTCTTAQLERAVREWRALQVHDEAELERRRHASRSLAVSPDGDGMYRIRGTLSPEVGALLMRAVEAAGDALFREGAEWAPGGGRRGPASRETTPRQRRADALGLLAERALAAGFGVGEEVEPEEGSEEMEGGGGEAEDGGEEAVREKLGGTVGERARGTGERGTPAQEPANAPAGACSEGASGASPCACGEPAPLSGTRAERYQVLIHVDAEALRTDEGVGADGAGAVDPTPRGLARLADSTPLSRESARRLSCDAATVRVTRGSEGEVLDIGRRSRTIPPALRRALQVRDGGCRFPGCGLRFTEGHHVLHWADGGETKLSNLVLLCRHHHRAVHEEGFRLRLEPDGRVRFFDRVGWPLPDVAPPPPVLPDRPVEALVHSNRRRGITPDWDTPSATYRGEADIPYDLEARFREALDPPA